ncbi:hypothetical protein PVAG01_10327 [Phlyctema vagabunda]|uniref:DUF6604 domain-containing protein n=1 Tax=Phlyctema vagabunda TaxID=108571 RepID=A0ABR4P666_9HELO
MSSYSSVESTDSNQTFELQVSHRETHSRSSSGVLIPHHSTAAVTGAYKNAEWVIKTWLSQQPHLAKQKYKASTMKRVDIISCVESFKGKHIPVPSDIQEAFNDSIYFRTVSLKYHDEKYKDNPELNKESREGHVFFLESMKQWYSQLLSYAAVPAKTEAAAPISATTALPTGSEPREIPAAPGQPTSQHASKPIGMVATNAEEDDVTALISQLRGQLRIKSGTKRQPSLPEWRQKQQQPCQQQQQWQQPWRQQLPSQPCQQHPLALAYYQQQNTGTHANLFYGMQAY